MACKAIKEYFAMGKANIDVYAFIMAQKCLLEEIVTENKIPADVDLTVYNDPCMGCTKPVCNDNCVIYNKE